MKVLVTGAAGFIGSHIADECLARGYEVFALDDLSGGALANVPQRATFCQMSVTEEAAVNSLVRAEKFDVIIHAAAYAAEGLSPFIRRYNYMNNVIGSTNLINAALNHSVGKFVFLSSAAVYGHGRIPFREFDAPAPIDPYGIGKFAVEMDLQAAHAQFGLNYTIYRPHNVYGERQNIHDRYRNVVGIFMRAALVGEPLRVFGDGLQTRPFTHVSDVAGPIVDGLGQPAMMADTFNIGSDDTYTVLDLATSVSEALGVKVNIAHVAARHEVQDVRLSHSKIRRLGYKSAVCLPEGLSRMATWARTQLLQPTKPFAAIEVERGLPEIWR